MKLKLTRRDLLGLAGGTAIGAVLTPAPWKLIDDLAIWTQNWSWIPRPPRGVITTKTTVCALCPAACALEARCVGNLPVSLTAQCALGLTGHHLPYHPARLVRPLRTAGQRRLPTNIDSIVQTAARGIAGGAGSFTVLDMRPGRSTSWAWRSLAAKVPSGYVVAAPGREGESVAALEKIAGGDVRFGLDLDNAKTIVSFGAPLAEGWGSPRNLTRLVARDGRPLFVHVEPVRSRTAELADVWLPAKPGTEGDLALGIAHVLIAQNLVAAGSLANAARYTAFVSAYTPEAVAATTGVPSSAIIDAARRIAFNGPAIVIAGEEPAGGGFDPATKAAILSLNVLLGSVNARGGYVARAELPEPVDEGAVAPYTELGDIQDRSIAVLIVDASSGDAAIPWPAIERKLSKGAAVIALTPYLAGTALHATHVVPTAPFLEASFEMPTAPDTPVATLAIAPSILEPRNDAQDPAAFVRAIANESGIALPGDWTTSGELVNARLARIHASRRGNIVNAKEQSTKSVAEFESADAIVEALKSGAVWMDDPARSNRLTYDLTYVAEAFLLRPAETHTLTLLPRSTRDVVASAAVSPVLTKIYQESGLRRLAGAAAINPRTARELRLSSGETARLQTAAGSANVTIAIDEAVMPGVIDLAIGPDAVSIGDRRASAQRRLIDICPADERGVWRASSAKLGATV